MSCTILPGSGAVTVDTIKFWLYPDAQGSLIANNLIDGAATGISITNLDTGGQLAVCNGNIVRNLSATGPYPADAPGF